ncbi:unnamed protein product [Anisakis simplex]|uniref:Reverse transcriptase domain-containing protein n=1 Tax=Anisakis simplex TaxID=6269 RepID=A0A0M3JD83_ANISI|nr:unnamed protein product [Anisakis simplex]
MSGASRTSRDQDEIISELEQRLMMVNGIGGAPNKKNQKSKLDSSQINDGDFEKIMNGLREGAYVTFDGPQSAKRYSGAPVGLTSKGGGIPPPVEPKPRIVHEVDRERS